MTKLKTIIVFLSFLLFLPPAYNQKITNKKTKESIQNFITRFSNTSKSSIQTKKITLDEGKEFTVEIIKTKKLNNKSIVTGYIEGQKNSSFFFTGDEHHVKGEIVFRDKKVAYSISSDEQGNIQIEKDDINKFLCIDYEKDQSSTPIDNKGVNSKAAPILNSYPGARGTIYLDFDGEFVSGGRWGTINASAVNYSNAQIEDIWALVAEDFRPFEINITTDRNEFTNANPNRRMMVIFTTTTTAAPGAGGVAYLRSFSDGSGDPCWVFNGGVKAAAETASHEAGHTLNLRHDGGNANPNYYGGHGNWGPIMGAVFNRDIVHWSKGEYSGANQFQDDIAIIAGNTNNVGYRVDDHPNNTTNATLINPEANGNILGSKNNGIIERENDLDYFEFTTSGGNVDFIFTSSTNTYSDEPNIDIQAKLLDNNGNQILTSNPNGLNARIQTNLTGGTYYIEIDGVGAGNPLNTGYSDYGSLGQYFITGNYPSTINQDPPQIVSITPNSSCKTVDFSANILNIVTQYSWDFGDGNTSSNMNPTHTYTNPGTYTVSLTATNTNGSDNSSTSVIVTVPSAPSTNGDVVCGSGVVNLSATGSNNLVWYDAANNGSVVNTGTTYSPNLTNTTTFYVEEQINYTISGGPSDNTIGGGGNFNNDQWLIFDVSEASTLVSVKVYAQGTGNRTIELVDANNNVLETTTVNIPNGEQRVQLNFPLPVGTDFSLRINGTKDLYRNNAGVNYPYSIGNLATITSSSAGSDFYYFFYDWELEGVGCSSSRTPVKGIINNACGVDNCPNDPNKTQPGDCGCGVADTDSDNDGTADCNDDCPNDPNKTAAGDCGCGVADTDSDNDGTADCNDDCPNDPNKTAPGNCGCGNVELTPCTVGINDLENELGIKIYPNPTSGILYIEMTETSNNFNFELLDVIGKTLESRILKAGTNQIDIVNYSNGIYFVKITNNNESSVYRIIKN